MRPALCIVLPVLDEAATLAGRLRALEGLRRRGARAMQMDALRWAVTAINLAKLPF